MKPPQMKTFSIRLSVSQYKQLQTLADAEQIPVSQLIRGAIRELLASNQAKPTSKI